MPIDNCPFTLSSKGKHRPFLAVKIINPYNTNKRAFGVFRTKAIIDTGADMCVIPSTIARILGFKLKDGTPKEMNAVGGSGKTIAYIHKATIEIYHPSSKDAQLLYATKNIPMCFVQNLQVVLLGVNHFLDQFVLTINYPERYFSIKHLNN